VPAASALLTKLRCDARGGRAQAVPLYLSEMAPPQMRGGLNIMFQMATTIGARPGIGRRAARRPLRRRRRLHACTAARGCHGPAAACCSGMALEGEPASLAERGAEGRARAQASWRRSW